MQSIWNLDKNILSHDSLVTNINADVAIIGAGMCGVLTAYLLNKKGVNVVVLEANTIGSGQTQNTTAKITSQHGLIYNNLINQFGESAAQQYATANQQAIAKYATIIRDNNIECDFERLSAYVYTLRDSPLIEDEFAAATKLGIDCEYVTETKLPFKIEGAVCFKNQAQFNPLKFIEKIVAPLKIYEHTLVTGIDKNVVITSHGKVTAKKIVVTAHYPFLKLPGLYIARLYEQRSYAIALKNAAMIDGMYIDECSNGYSFRNYRDMLILGGAGHRVGENSEGGCYDDLRKSAKRYYPESQEVTCWSAQDCMPLDGIPYIGQYTKSMKDVYIATGFQKWGMSTSMVAANIICDSITGKSNKYKEVFSPQRLNLRASYKNITSNISHSTKGLMRNLTNNPQTKIDDVPVGHGAIVSIDGEKSGVYKDKDSVTHIVSVTCPHMGCQLEWNPDELSWDCPCHGSRFDFDGNLLNGPALKGTKIKHDKKDSH